MKRNNKTIIVVIIIAALLLMNSGKKEAGEQVQFRTTDPTYAIGSAIAYTSTCGNTLTAYGYSTKFSNYYDTCAATMATRVSGCGTATEIMSVTGGWLTGSTSATLWKCSSLPTMLYVCDTIAGTNSEVKRYDPADSDASKVSTSPAVTGSNEVLCTTSSNCPGTMAGDGSLSNACKITNCLQLQDMNLNVNVNYELVNNIDCSATSGWNGGTGFNPIVSFKSTFNGNNYNIYSLSINRPSTDNVGLFNALNGNVKNLKLYINLAGRDYVGGLSGSASGSIISNVNIIGNITQLGPDYGQVGGMIGASSGNQITNCSFVGNINSVQAAGGLVGTMQAGTSVNKCYSSGKLTSTKQAISGTGGLIGTALSSSVQNSYSSMSITTATYNYQVGGLIGKADWTPITNCYSRGDLSNARVSGGLGGLIGLNSNGFDPPVVVSSYWDTEASHVSTSSGGTGLTSLQMYDKLNYMGWDFTNIWQENAESYPTLRVASACTPNWQCTTWGTCLASCTQTRICTDSNNCGVTTGKPLETQSCTGDACLICENAADTNLDCTITLAEVITYATKWVNNQGVTLTELILSANIWVDGGTYTG